jgi:hypothetical protein
MNVQRIVPVLAAIGSDAAVMELATIAARQKNDWMKQNVDARLVEIAAKRGWSIDELDERMTPTCDLEADGSRVFDYGSRKFRVGFDEHLAPFVTDEEGATHRALPPARAKDDKEKVKAAQRAWTDLKEDVEVGGGRRIAVLERALASGRRWRAEDFHALWIDHAFARHIARRVVFAVQAGADVRAFRVAEDGTLADAEDAAVTLDEGAEIVVAHPIDLDDATRARWHRVLEDYMIIQPFVQLERPIFRLTSDEESKSEITRPRDPAAAPAANHAFHATHGWTQKTWSATPLWKKSLGADIEASVTVAEPLVVRVSRGGDPLPLSALTPRQRSELLFTAGVAQSR